MNPTTAAKIIRLLLFVYLIAGLILAKWSSGVGYSPRCFCYPTILSTTSRKPRGYWRLLRFILFRIQNGDEVVAIQDRPVIALSNLACTVTLPPNQVR